MKLLIFTYFVFMINEMSNVGRNITSERSYDIGQTIAINRYTRKRHATCF